MSMSITLTTRKKEKIKTLCTCILNINNTTIREVGQVVGNIAAVLKALTFGKLNYCLTE